MKKITFVMITCKQIRISCNYKLDDKCGAYHYEHSSSSKGMNTAYAAIAQ